MKTSLRNQVLDSMMVLLDQNRNALIAANQEDLRDYSGREQAMLDRLKIDLNKIDDMIESVRVVKEKPDPVNVERYQYEHPNGLKIYNRTAPFGTILIIYESRPDVTVEAAVIAFKAGNKILLKGGKEALKSNTALVGLWHQALKAHGCSHTWIQYLNYNRSQTQEFLCSPDLPADLIVPRGGEQLISFVKQHASVPVLVSGRGNNFVYVHQDANPAKVESIILNAKTHKISACNALDKVLIHEQYPDLNMHLRNWVQTLQNAGVEVWVDRKTQCLIPHMKVSVLPNQDIWEEEFLEMKIVIGLSDDHEAAIEKINTHSGKHSISIITEDHGLAQSFMEQIDAAAVYHNASTRFTDGFQMGLGAELAISTDKLHHRGPLGLEHLVTNKWYIYGNGQVR